MKKLFLFISVTLLLTGMSFSQKVNMKVGEKIEVEEITNKKGNKLQYVFFRQDGQELKYVKMYKTLGGMEECSENMKLSKKYRTAAIAMLIIGVATMPLGYLILIGPIMNKKRKELKYVILAIDDYNESLE